uniref:Uncharacterized protein n=1 Tax=Vitis vinifera TaxID=29760 RepID=A5B8J9_VITVI|nr:hypothetical protein VITISV_020145 [Vitis vinifera]
MAATSSFQLRIAHRLKHWIVDFLRFEMESVGVLSSFRHKTDRLVTPFGSRMNKLVGDAQLSNDQLLTGDNESTSSETPKNTPLCQLVGIQSGVENVNVWKWRRGESLGWEHWWWCLCCFKILGFRWSLKIEVWLLCSNFKEKESGERNVWALVNWDNESFISVRGLKWSAPIGKQQFLLPKNEMNVFEDDFETWSLKGSPSRTREYMLDGHNP